MKLPSLVFENLKAQVIELETEMDGSLKEPGYGS